MIRIKPGVKVFGVRPEIVYALHVVDGVWLSFGLDGPTITSCRDGMHSQKSLHNVGAAVDIRSRDIDAALKLAILEKLKECLTDEFDVLLEYRGEAREHYHIEFQPKGI